MNAIRSHNNADFIFDVETNHLPFHYFNSHRLENGKLQLPTFEEINKNFRHMELLQFGYFRPNHENKIQHIQITDPFSTVHAPVVPNTLLNRTKEIRGQKQPVQIGRTQATTKEDIFNFLTAKDSGKPLSKRQVKYYMDVVAPTFTERSMANKYIVKTSPVNELDISEFSLGIFNKTDKEVEKQIMSHADINFIKQGQEAFYNRNNKQGLFALLDDLMHQATTTTPKTIMAWNAQFDASVLLTMIAKYGDKVTYDKFVNLYKTGALNIVGIEREWQVIAYKLAKENPDIASRLTINWNPVAFKETGGKSGQVASTFEEFKHSMPWNVEDVSKLFKWHPSVAKALKMGKEEHLAGADLKLEVALKEAFEDVLREYSGNNTASMTDAFRTLIEQQVKQTGSKTVNELKDELIDIIDRNNSAKKFRSIWRAKTGGGGGGGGRPPFIGGFFDRFGMSSESAKYAKYSGVVVALGLLAAGTYFGSREAKEKKSSDSMSFTKKGLKNEFSALQDHNKSGFMHGMAQLTKIGLTAAAGLWTLGMAAAIHDPNVLGAHKDMSMPTSLGEIMSKTARTMLYGAKRLEAAIPTFKLFRISSIHNYLNGGKRYQGGVRVVGDEVEHTGKWKIFNTIERGEIKPIGPHGPYGSLKGHGIEVGPFLEAAQVTNPELYDELSAVLNPTRVPEGIDRRTIRITTDINGAAIVSYEDYSIIGGIEQKVSGRPLTIDVDLVMADLRLPNVRNISSGARKTGEFGRSVDPISYMRIQENLVRSGRVSKIELADYLKIAKKSEFIKRNPTFEPIWKAIETARWKLDMLPKGIGGGQNVLYPEMTKLGVSTDTILLPKSLRGAHKWSKDGIRTMLMHYRQIAREYSITPMNNFLENPFEVIGVNTKHMNKAINTLTKSRNPVFAVAGKALDFINSPHLGLPTYSMKGGIARYMLDIGVKRILPAAGLIGGFNLVNHVLGALTFSKGAGPLTDIPIAMYHGMQLMYSKISDITGFTKFAKKQEQVAPGSTGLGMLAPSLGAMVTFSVGKYLYKRGPSYLREGMDNIGKKVVSDAWKYGPWIKHALRKEAYSGAVQKSSAQRIFNWMIKNPKMSLFGMMMAPMVPFFPGFIGSNKSYEERKAIINGKREVAIRKNRGWVLSSSAWQGGKVIQYRREALNLIKSDWQNKGVIYPSYWKRALHNFSFGLFDRYMLEDYHKDSQPVYKSAPYGSNVPLVGPIIAGTLGRLIKPRRTYHEPGEGESGSPFEHDIYNTLKQRGFTVYPQVQQNGYYIDMVVRTGDKEIAIEADGKMFHSGKKKIEDAKRQAELEAMGWSFLRVKSDDYFNDREATLNRLESQLREAGFKPEGKGGIPDDLKQQYFARAIAKNISVGVIGEGKETFITGNEDLHNAMAKSEHIVGKMGSKFYDQATELAGFKGFLFRAAIEAAGGDRSFDSMIPRMQDAGEMYNPAQVMWGWRAGDITTIGGEFLRRVFQNPRGKWDINDIPNEFYGVSWIPQQNTDIWESGKSRQPRDFTHGTTFDKVPQGWLMASRKGWEFLYPEEKGKDLEDYSDPVRLEILQAIAPYSEEFKQTSRSVMQLALNNNLTPEEEQRYYETLTQVNELKKQIYAHDQQYTYSVSTEKYSGRVTSLNEETGTFTLDSFGERQFRVAGVNTSQAAIRARLLQKNSYDNAQDLDEDAQEISDNVHNILRDRLSPGKNISMSIAGADQLPDTRGGQEALISGLQDDLFDAGAPFADTGHLATHNIAQEKAGSYHNMLAKYWEHFSNKENFFTKKLVPDRDYLMHYLDNQVFSKEVRLWQHPIEHLIKPMGATIGRKFGIDKIPEFTEDRREKQQYWDIVKYLKYKMLANQATTEGNYDKAAFYHNKWRSTMIGADPTDENIRDEMTALPQNERAYFDFFSNESDPDKRGRIFKFLPEASKRIYKSIWARKIAEAGTEEDRAEFEEIRRNEGFDLSDSDIRDYERETHESITRADWARAKIIQEYAKDHALPDQDWIGYSEEVDIEDVETLSLLDQGEQTQDYGYFEDRIIKASYNPYAQQAARDINSISSSSSDVAGMLLPFIANMDAVQMANGTPTTSISPFSMIEETTDEDDQYQRRNSDRYGSQLNSNFSYSY